MRKERDEIPPIDFPGEGHRAITKKVPEKAKEPNERILDSFIQKNPDNKKIEPMRFSETGFPVFPNSRWIEEQKERDEKEKDEHKD